LLGGANDAIAELGFGGAEGDNMVVVANTPAVHNMIVCTLCSCYPWPVLGLPPSWYKSPPYRARAVSEPRAVLREFGLEIGDNVEIRVWDSSAEVRYLVLPMRPTETSGWSEKELAAIVTRNCMIGTAVPGAAEATIT
jgi:nitrile hydratase